MTSRRLAAIVVGAFVVVGGVGFGLGVALAKGAVR